MVAGRRDFDWLDWMKVYCVVVVGFLVLWYWANVIQQAVKG